MPVLLMLALLLTTAGAPPPVPPHARLAEEVVLDRTFDVKPGSRLSVAVSDADVIIETREADEARIRVVLRARDLDAGRAYFESQRFDVRQDGDVVRVRTNPERRSGLRWRNASLTVIATIPARFGAEIRTADGDIRVPTLVGRVALQSSDGDIVAGDLEGPEVSIRTSDGDVRTGRLTAERIRVQTSDGDLRLGALRGDELTVRTSDGDIRVDRLDGDADVVTSDGDVSVGDARGGTLRLRTSDGDVRAESLVGRTLEVRTSDGEISLAGVDGTLEAAASSGDVHVQFLKPGRAMLRSGDGDIVVELPSGADLDVDLRGDDVAVDRALDFAGDRTDEHVRGRLGAGGPLLEARSSSADIVVRVYR